MGCNQSKKQDIKQEERERERTKVPRTTPLVAPTKEKDGFDQQSRSYTDQRQDENEAFVSDLRKFQTEQFHKIIEKAQKSMFEINQTHSIDAEELSEREKKYQRELVNLKTVNKEIELSGLNIKTTNNEPLDEDVKLVTKCFDSLSDAFNKMQISPCGELVVSL
eukprot:TRINITY_DN1859_c0_g1_i1.p1 TRINITY_DN1859_c0_g1~~TRINITY_DN1859_c0_g1_i1.p1  ORF type:complete len:164 (-),score=31.11 TRINITY_DN1859_c0_g1_i1:70-561(-)